MIKLIIISVLFQSFLSYADLNFDVFIKNGILVQIDVFSGRPNPEYLITDSISIAAIVEKLSIYTASNVDSALIKYPDSPTCDGVTPPKSGYRGLYIGVDHLDTFLINVGSQTLAYRDNIAQTPCKYIWDLNSELEKMVIAAMPQDSLVKFWSLIPDSLKPNTEIKTAFFNIQPTIRNDIILSNYPNPFSFCTAVKIVPSGAASIKIFDYAGNLIRILYGNKNVVWDGTDKEGRAVSNGLYYLLVVMDGKAAVGRVVKIGKDSNSIR